MEPLHLGYATLTLAATSVALALALLAQRRIAHRRAAALLVGAMLAFFASGVANFALSSGLPGDVALPVSHVFYFSETMTSGLIMAFVATYFHGWRASRNAWLTPALLGLVLAASLVVSLQVRTAVGLPLEAIIALSIAGGAFILTAIALLLWTLRATSDGIVRRQAAAMVAGLLALVAGGVWEALQVPEDPGQFPSYAFGAVAMTTAFTGAILRYRLFSLEGSAEDREDTDPWVDLRPSKSYLVKDRSKHRAFTIFADAVRHGRPGVCITRSHPAAVREDYGLRHTPLLRLTTALGQNQVPPSELPLLLKVVRKAIADRERPVVLLEGVEYLLVYNGFDAVLRCLHEVRDACEAAGGSFLVALETALLDEREAALVEGEFVVLEDRGRGDCALEDVFVIDGSGVLLVHNTRRLGALADHDQLAAMLSAIENFSRDALREGGSLRTLDLGGRRVALEKGERLIVAVVFTGNEPPWLRREMRSLLGRAERRFGALLEGWDGDIAKMEPLRVMTNRLLA